MENTKRKKLIIISAAIVLLLCVLFGCSRLSILKNDNTMNVVQTQDNSFDIPSYSENDSYVFSFLPAEDAEGDLTYELISAKNQDYKNVDYFSLVSEKDTRIMVAKGTPAGTYTLTIRAHASGNDRFKEAVKDITFLYTIGKADNGYLSVPEPIEGLVYNGEAQQLVHGGTALYGTIMYKVDDGEWSSEIPTMSEAGIYTVSYKVIGDENHKDIDEQSFMVVIEQQKVAYRPGVSFSGSYSLGGLLDYIKQKADSAASSKIHTTDKPANLVEYTYDGNEHTNGYTAPSGIVMVGEDRGTCAGTYIAVYTPDYNHCWNDGTRTPVVVTLKIHKKKLAVPTIDDSLYYTGKTQEAIINGFDEETMLVVGNKAKNPGTYYAVVALKDIVNYTWDTDSINDLIL
ncbi:MAG: hypothetical protein J6S49_06155 [Erysipelotrichaceae bacterium]|nr:hypothetical protein [Erysipelotrichaceae bacterium]